jgi:hypothetical protein
MRTGDPHTAAHPHTNPDPAVTPNPEHFAPTGWLIVEALKPRQETHMTTNPQPTLLERVAALRAQADRLEATHCTGIAAQWCPTHGTCTCPERDDDMGRTLNDPRCPLHRFDSSHAEGVTT